MKEFTREDVICAVCNKPVEALEQWFDIIERATVFKAVCHGQEQSFALSVREVHQATSLKLGRAFEHQALPENRPA